MRMLGNHFWLFLVALAASVLPLRAQEEVVPFSTGEIRFALDHMGFRDSTGKTREKFFCQIGYDQLHFTRQTGRYRAQMELTAVLYDGKGNQIVGDNWEKTYEVKDYEATVASGQPLVEAFSFLLGPGKYRLRVNLVDPRANRQGLWEGEFVAPGFSLGHADISELAFLNQPLTARLDTLEIDPPRMNPLRAFADSAPTVRWFFEVYGPTPPGASLLYTISDRHGSRRMDSARPLEAIPDRSLRGIQDSLSLDSLEGGTYLLATSLVDGAGKSLARRDVPFEFLPFYAPLARSFGEALDLLGYIASSADLDSLKRVPPADRRRAWETFWRKRDPSLGTARNEDREQFYERVAYANQNFSRFQRGWKTDMGRVYIKFGLPDETERHPFDANSPAYEIWYYYAVNRQFVFVDRHGLGDYTLSNWGAYLKN